MDRRPTLADVAALVDESRAAGMRITARIELGDAAPRAAVGRTAYRIVQEGLTNARKHAPGAAVTLTVHAPDGDLQVEVRSLAPRRLALALGETTQESDLAGTIHGETPPPDLF